MKNLDWDKEKNSLLKELREVSFQDVQAAIDEGKVLDDLNHPNKQKYPNQRIMVIEIDDYAYYVPYVEDEKKIFLKTIFPSRKATKKYLSRGEKK